MPRAARVGALVLACSLAPRWASAHADGREVNRATVGCGALGNCHGVNPGATATLTGPMTVQAGSRSTYVLTLRSTYPGFVGGGFDVGALGPAGTSLAVNAAQANTRINGADLVMNSRFAAAGGAVTVTFDLVTPTAGAATINAAGNATNGVGSAGDAWARATLAVTVVPSTTPDAGARDAGPLPRDAGAADVVAVDVPPNAGGDSGLEAYDITASYGYGGCRVGPSGARRGALGWAWLLALSLLARRRRGGSHA
ncbi:MAG: hypothetical protein EPO40_14040 [Myxococcaceae bacterium]|nr:MAG: hypothetical protein EPO40_14040 [Myxococcaceae bacterium]